MAELPIILEALQTCEAELEELERLTAQLPKDIEGALERAAAARAAVEAEEQKLEKADHERRAHEAEMQDCEAKRAKYQGQTALVKTNTEYTALLSEIDVMTRRISELEEQILLGMEVIDEVSGRLTTFRVEKQREERELIGSADELKRKLGESEAELEALRDGSPLADPKLEALRAFASAVVQELGWVSEEEVDGFLAAGFEREQVLDVVVGVAYKTLSNYTNHLAGTPLDSAFAAFAWEPPEKERATRAVIRPPSRRRACSRRLWARPLRSTASATAGRRRCRRAWSSCASRSPTSSRPFAAFS